MLVVEEEGRERERRGDGRRGEAHKYTHARGRLGFYYPCS